jgi:Tfp pilus assembly protein PilF
MNALLALAISYAETRQIDKALSSLEQALQIAQSTGNQKLIEQITQRIDLYRQRPPANRP